MKVEVIESYRDKERGREKMKVGDTFEVDDKRARFLISMGWVKFVQPSKGKDELFTEPIPRNPRKSYTNQEES